MGTDPLVAMGIALIARVLRVTDVVVLDLRGGGQRKLAFAQPLTLDERHRFAAALRRLGWPVANASGD